MTQVNLGQESVKEVMTELKSSLERKPRNNKRGYYQTTDCARLSSGLNFTYFDREYGKILKVPKNRKKRFLELHETAQKWEILNYHLKVICTDNQEHISPPVLETDAYMLREEAYLTISIVSKLFKYMGFASKQNPDYNSFQGFIATMFRGLVERKISLAICQYEYNKELDVLTDVILLYREYTPDAKPPYEDDPGLYHHMPELYERDHSYLNQLEMKCSDIITRYCFFPFHAEYPMKFGEGHKYMTFRMYKVLHEDNIPVGEVVPRQSCMKGLSIPPLREYCMKYMDLLLHIVQISSSKKKEWQSYTQPLVPRSMNV